MIRVEGENPVTVLKRAAHHAYRVLPLIEALSLALMYESRIAKDGREHVLRQSRAGANSFGLHLADGRELHFRGNTISDHYDSIAVYDRWTYARDGVAPLAILSTPEECRQFAASTTVAFNPFAAKAHGIPVAA